MEPDLLNQSGESAEPLYAAPREFSLVELYAKISSFPEAVQMENPPMLSKASVLAQIASARALERIADSLESSDASIAQIAQCVDVVEWALKVRAKA